MVLQKCESIEGGRPVVLEKRGKDRTGTVGARNLVLVDVKWVAEVLNCSQRHVMRLRDSGMMPRAIKLGALLRWNRREIESWIEGGCQADR